MNKYDKILGEYRQADTMDLSGYVPYTGATGDVDLGAHILKVGATSTSTHSINIGGTTASMQIGNAFAYTPVIGDLVVGSSNSNSRFMLGQSNTRYGGLLWNYNATVANAFLSVGNMNGVNTSGLNIFQNGNVSIGTISSLGKLYVTGASLPVIACERTTSLTTGAFNTLDGMASGFLMKTRTDGDMGDGFGGGIVFANDDSAAYGDANYIARIYARRDGADNVGALQFWTGASGGVPTMTIRGTGNVGIGTASPGAKLHVKGTAIQLEEATTDAGAAIQFVRGTDGVARNMISTVTTGSTGKFDLKFGIDSSHWRDVYIGTNNAANGIVLKAGGNVGIGTTSPVYQFEVGDKAPSALAKGIRSWAGFDIYQVPNPTVPTGVASAGAGLEIGNYIYQITYYTAIGETSSTASATITTTAGNQQITLTIPVSTDPRVIGRKIYRTKVGQPVYTDYLLTTIANNTATSYVDSTPDASLTGVTPAVYFKINTTSGFITLNGIRAMVIDRNLVTLGGSAGFSITTGGRSVFIGNISGYSTTSGIDNNFLGSSSGYSNTSGSQNNFFGYGAGSGNTTASNNTYFGHDAGLFNQTGAGNTAFGSYSQIGSSGYQNRAGATSIGYSSLYNITTSTGATAVGYLAGYGTTSNNYGVFLGYYAGRYETGGNALIIDNIDRTTEALGRSNALIYGVSNATAANQILQLGGGGKVGIGTVSPETKFHIIGTTEQLRTGYDTSNYLSSTTTSTGTTTLNPVGTTPYLLANKLVYGSMYADDVTLTVTVSATATYYAVGTGLTTGLVNGMTFANSTLTALVAGKYKVDWAMTLQCTNANQEVSGAVMINTTVQINTEGATKLTTGGDNKMVTGSGIITLAVNDVVKLSVENETATNNITITHASLSLVRIDS